VVMAMVAVVAVMPLAVDVVALRIAPSPVIRRQRCIRPIMIAPIAQLTGGAPVTRVVVGIVASRREFVTVGIEAPVRAVMLVIESIVVRMRAVMMVAAMAGFGGGRYQRQTDGGREHGDDP